MKKENSTHIYDLGKFRFNQSTDVDLLLYHEVHFGPRTKHSSFKLKSTTTVAEFATPCHESVKLVVPFESPREATEALLKGLRATVEKVNEQIQEIGNSKKLHINLNKIKVTEYAKIKTSSENFDLFFPVDVNTSVETSSGPLEVSINLDNPTSLHCSSQANGCQGSHFGYTIIGNDGRRIRGHVLITTFIGYPSRDETFKLLPTESPTTKLVSFAKLYQVALGKKSLRFDISTEKGIREADDDEMLYQNDRIKKLPFELQRIHNTFASKHFTFPSRKNISQVCDQ